MFAHFPHFILVILNCEFKLVRMYVKFFSLYFLRVYQFSCFTTAGLEMIDGWMEWGQQDTILMTEVALKCMYCSCKICWVLLPKTPFAQKSATPVLMKLVPMQASACCHTLKTVQEQPKEFEIVLYRGIPQLKRKGLIFFFTKNVTTPSLFGHLHLYWQVHSWEKQWLFSITASYTKM